MSWKDKYVHAIGVYHDSSNSRTWTNSLLIEKLMSGREINKMLLDQARAGYSKPRADAIRLVETIVLIDRAPFTFRPDDPPSPIKLKDCKGKALGWSWNPGHYIHEQFFREVPPEEEEEPDDDDDYFGDEDDEDEEENED